MDSKMILEFFRHALFLSLPIPFFFRRAFVMQFLAFGKTNFNFHPIVFPASLLQCVAHWGWHTQLPLKSVYSWPYNSTARLQNASTRELAIC